jgi:hypothetical protein
MAPIPFPTSSSPGARPSESAGRLINAMAEALGTGAVSPAKIIRVPGLSEFADHGAVSGFRGAALMGGVLYQCYNGTLRTVGSDGTEGTFNVLAGTEPVFFAHNNKLPVSDKVVVTENGAFTLDISDNSIDAYGDADLPQPTDVCFGDGYFFFAIQDGRCFASGLNSTSIVATDFATAESKSDILLRSVFYGGQLYLCGAGTIEVWDGSTVNSTGFPFNRVTVIQRGLISKRAITGHEDGFGLSLCITGENGVVYVLKGYEPHRISTPDVERDIAALADKSEIRMTCFVVGGHPCIVVKSNSWTWVFDLSTQTWHERKSYLSPAWRAEKFVWAFNKWLCADSAGKVGEIKTGVYSEYGDHLVWEVHSVPSSAFPKRVPVSRADFNFAAGVGASTGVDPMETDPQVEISWSDNGGETWSSPLKRDLGREGRYNEQVTVTRTGQTGPKGRRWKLRVSDPVYVSLLGGDMEARGA